MARPRLSRISSVTEQVRLPEDLAEAFRSRCDDLGKTRSEVLRSLIARWLRHMAELQRLKGDS